MVLVEKKHSIGKTIAELRKEKGWTQIELAEKLQVSDKTISKWEKDNGAPSVEFFPALAEVFGVSIDYLMTGKKVESEIIVISKAELCAKKDDASMVKGINLQTKDENGKTLIDYIVQYKSYKVFAAICDEKEFINLQDSNDRNVKKFDVVNLIEFALITNKVSVLDRHIVLNMNYSVDDIKGLLHIDDFEKFEKRESFGAKYRCLITDKLLDIIVQDERINSNTIRYLLSKQKGRECIWYLVFPYILHQSYLHNNIELFNQVLNASISNNQYAYDKMPIKNGRYSEYNSGYNYEIRGNKGHGLVRALEKTIKLALERSDIDTVEKLNNLNIAVMEYYKQFKCYIATTDEIRIAKLKLDKTVSKNEIKIQSTIHDGIVCIDELLEIDKFEMIKSTLEKYPIHQLELLFNMVKENQLRELFQKAVDINDSTLAKLVIKNEKEDILEHIFSYWKGVGNINIKHLYYVENGKTIELFQQSYGIANYNAINVDDAITKLYLCKKRIIDEASLKINKDKIVEELTKKYFERELSKGNIDMVIIQLCVRLEAILRSDYHYEGDFSEMLKKYCEKQLTWEEDDGWGYMEWRSEEKTIELLNALRMNRNSIVHSKKSNITLTMEDIKYCIDYICNLG